MEENKKKKKKIIIGTVIGVGVALTIIFIVGAKIVIDRLIDSTFRETITGLMKLSPDTVETISDELINDIKTNKHDNRITDSDIQNEINEMIGEIKDFTDENYTNEEYNELFNKMYESIKEKIDEQNKRKNNLE